MTNAFLTIIIETGDIFYGGESPFLLIIYRTWEIIMQEVYRLATAQEIQDCIDSCTQAANALRSSANTFLCAMNRQNASLGAAHIEMCINTCVVAKTLKT